MKFTKLCQHGRKISHLKTLHLSYIWDKVFNNGPSKTCGRQPLTNLKGRGLPKADQIPLNFLKAVFH